MTIDIIFFGAFKTIWVKQRSKRYFSKSKYICRNNVFVDVQTDNTYHIEKNSIHVSLSSIKTSNIESVCSALNNILKNVFIGIKTSDLLYTEIEKCGKLNGLRM